MKQCRYATNRLTFLYYTYYTNRYVIMKFDSRSLLFLALSSSITSAHENHITLSNETVHWGYFSKSLSPVLTVDSGETVTVEMATHHACDDWDKMIKGDAGMESVYTWDESGKNEDFRGATGGGDGVHILTGPIHVKGAMPGDLLKVEILDLYPRKNPDGKTYGSNAAAWWGFQARVDKVNGEPFYSGSHSNTPDESDEVVTIYEIDGDYAIPSYQFEWPKITDPQGTNRDFIAYPGTCVPHDARDSTDVSSDVDSIPPMATGGNLDNKRIGKGTTMLYPVDVEGGLISMGDAHTAQGDSELDGTGIETSLTGDFKLTVVSAADFEDWHSVIDFPLGETDTEYIVHGFTETNYLETYAENPSDIFSNPSIDKAMKNCYTQTRKFVMARWGLTENEATTVITQGVDFAMTQLVDGNWGVHAVVPKAVFEGGRRTKKKGNKSKNLNAKSGKTSKKPKSGKALRA